MFIERSDFTKSISKNIKAAMDILDVNIWSDEKCRGGLWLGAWFLWRRIGFGGSNQR